MADDPTFERASVPSGWVQRTRTGLANAGSAARHRLERLRGGKPSAIAEEPVPGPASGVDEVPGSPTDLADADVSVQRAWKHVRLVIAIVGVVAPLVMALVSWRIKVWRAQRRG